MSTYEDYGRAAVDYDSTRLPVGTEIVLGAMAARGVDPGDAHVLDAGCGTGSYAAAVAPHVDALTLVDANAAMLAEAKAKLSDAVMTTDTAVGLCQGVLTDLPFDDDTFDAVMVNQVLHHLGDEPDDSWDGHAGAIEELSRVLRPGGVMTVNTCSQDQLDHGDWYYALIPDAAAALRSRYAPLAALEGTMSGAGLEPSGRFVPVGEPLQGPAYLDGRAPLDEAFRNGDSAWQLASPHELEAAIGTVNALVEDGGLDAFVADHDRDRARIGQVTFVVAARP